MIHFNQKIELPTTEISMDGGKSKEKPEEKEDQTNEQTQSDKEITEQKNGDGQEQKAAGV
jgi:hypothetical protein